MRPEPGFAQTDIADDLATLKGSSLVAIVQLGAGGKITSVNRRFADLIGAPVSDALHGRCLEDLLGDDDHRALWRKALQDGNGAGLELEFLRADGKRCAMRGELHRSGPALRAVFVDISDELELRRAVQRGARLEALGSLTSGVAHDFNNLLTVLIGNLSLAAEELREHPSAFAKLRSAREAARRGSDLIRQLLDFARREAAAVDIVDPAPVIDRLTELLRRALGKRVELETEVVQGCGPVRANVALLESAIVNLAVNARDAVQAHGRVRISARDVTLVRQVLTGGAQLADGDYVELAVRDNGCGMAADLAERAVQPFVSTKQEHGGTGLGLSMVRTFAEQAQGGIVIESREGAGTTVKIFLPRCSESADETAARTMPLSTLPTGDERVLVVSRDEGVRSTVSQILEVLGYQVMTAGSLHADAAQKARLQLLILDAGCVEDDDALAAWLAAIPSIVLSSGAGHLRVAATSTLRKPFALADLAALVRETLDAVKQPAG